MWLRKHFQMQHDDIIFARDKSVIPCVTLIDDKKENVEKWSEQNNGNTAFLVSQPWNENPQGYERCMKLQQGIEWYTTPHLDGWYTKSVIRTNDYNYILKKIKRKFDLLAKEKTEI
jgi:hypothetical protein